MCVYATVCVSVHACMPYSCMHAIVYVYVQMLACECCYMPACMHMDVCMSAHMRGCESLCMYGSV